MTHFTPMITITQPPHSPADVAQQIHPPLLHSSFHAARYTEQHENELPMEASDTNTGDKQLSADERMNLSFASREWQNTYHNGSYSSLQMLAFILEKTETSYETFLTDPNVILNSEDRAAYELRVGQLGPNDDKRATDDEFLLTKAWLNGFDNNAFDSVVNNGTGRCTSFVIQTVRALEQKHPDVFDFTYFRLGIHHLARCNKTQIVIDSTNTPFILRPYQRIRVDATFDAYHRTWQFLPPDSSLIIKEHEDGDTGKYQVSGFLRGKFY